MSRFDRQEEDWGGAPPARAPVPVTSGAVAPDSIAAALAAVQAAAASLMSKAPIVIENREARRLYIGNIPSGANSVSVPWCVATRRPRDPRRRRPAV